MKMNNLTKFVIAVGVCEMAGAAGFVFTVSAIPVWYAGLAKPAFNLPGWVFGPVWTALYALMGISLFLIWKSGFSVSLKERRMGIFLFFIQLFLNAIWSIIFFVLKNPGWALADIIFLWLAVFGTIIVFCKISRLAALLLLPYIIWVSFAGFLNYSIWVLNREAPREYLIQVENLKTNETIASPFIVRGTARGFWFFEASFPVKLFDENGELLATAIAQAESDWMTEDFVPFSAELKFELPKTEKGVIVLEKDNPSGLPEHADELRIPVIFAKETRKINLYYYNYELDKDEQGNITCSRKGLTPVERAIPITQTPVQDAVKLLLLGGLTVQERAQGIETEYPLEGFSLKGASLKDGILTLGFSDPNSKTVGGSCRVGILWFQIEATAKQFSEVRQVRFLPEEIFQP